MTEKEINIYYSDLSSGLSELKIYHSWLSVNRSWKWATLISSPVYDGKLGMTRYNREIPNMLEQSLVRHVENAYRLECLENLFISDGGQYDLDLQYCIYKTCEVMEPNFNPKNLMNIIKYNLLMLLEVAPDLVDAKFLDGEDVACSLTKKWIKQLLADNSNNSDACFENYNKTASCNDYVDNIIKKLDNDNINDNLVAIEKLCPAHDIISSGQQELIQAIWCARNSELDIAISSLESLVDKWLNDWVIASHRDWVIFMCKSYKDCLLLAISESDSKSGLQNDLMQKLSDFRIKLSRQYLRLAVEIFGY